MKNLLLCLLLVSSTGGEKYLEEVALYHKDSYFKHKVYAEHNWKSFYELKEANTNINPNNYDLHLLNAAVFYATNKIREEKKLNALIFSPELRDAAVVHTWQMVQKKFFHHFNSKTPKLRSPDDRIQLFLKGYRASGENIDYNNVVMPSDISYIQLAEQIVDAWFHSPPHKKNMLSRQYSHLGCAAVFESKDKDGRRYVKATQNFCLN